MYRHEGNNVAENDTDDESDDADTDDDSMDVDVENIKPVLEKFEKLSVKLKKHFGPLQCDMCEFEAKNENGLTTEDAQRCKSYFKITTLIQNNIKL